MATTNQSHRIDQKDLKDITNPGVRGDLGNAQSRAGGTVLPYGGQNKGPDLSRLFDTLGIYNKEKTKEVQNAQVDEAELRTRQALLDNSIRGENESEIEHNNRIKGAVDAVKTEVNSGAERSIWGDDDKANETIDMVYASEASQLTKTQLANLRETMKGADPAAILQESENIMSEAFGRLGNMSKKAKIGFLRNVNQFSLLQNETIQKEAIEAKVLEQEKLVHNVHFTEINQQVEGLTGIPVDKSKQDIQSYNEYHHRLDQSSVVEGVSDQVQAAYDATYAFTKDKHKAMDAAMKLAVSSATHLNRPEILDAIGKKDLSGSNKSGQTGNRFYGELLAKTKERIESGNEQLRRTLVNKEQNDFAVANKSYYSNKRLESQPLIEKALTDPANAKASAEARENVTMNLAELKRDIEDGKYVGNEDQAVRLQELYHAQSRLVSGITGNQSYNDMFIQKAALNEWSLADQNRYIDGLSPENKRLSSQITAKEMDFERNMNTEEQFRQRTLKQQVIQEATYNVSGTIGAFHEANKDNMEIAMKLQGKSDQFGGLGAFQPINPTREANLMSNEIHEAISDKQLQIFKGTDTKKGENRAITVDEMNQLIQPIQDKYKKKVDDYIKSFEPYRGKFEATRNIEGRGQEILKGSEFKKGDMAVAADLLNEGKIDRNKWRDILIEDVRAKAIEGKFETPSDVLGHIFKSDAFDMTDPAAVERVSEIIRKGLGDTSQINTGKKTGDYTRLPNDTSEYKDYENIPVKGDIGKVMSIALKDNKFLPGQYATYLEENYFSELQPEAKQKAIAMETAKMQELWKRSQALQKLLKANNTKTE